MLLEVFQLQVKHPNKKHRTAGITKKVAPKEMQLQAQKQWIYCTEPTYFDAGNSIWRDVPKELWGMLEGFFSKGSDQPQTMKLPTALVINEHESFKHLASNVVKTWTVVENNVDTPRRELIVQLKDKRAQRQQSLYIHFRWWMIGDASTWQAG